MGYGFAISAGIRWFWVVLGGRGHSAGTVISLTSQIEIVEYPRTGSGPELALQVD